MPLTELGAPVASVISTALLEETRLNRGGITMPHTLRVAPAASIISTALRKEPRPDCGHITTPLTQQVAAELLGLRQSPVA